MRIWIGAVAGLLLAVPAGAAAQHAGHMQHGTRSEHADKVGRAIKALAPERVDALLAGEGAGYALPAELNRYPGPRHVLDMAEELGLDDDQARQVTTIFDAMQSRAVELGRQLVSTEEELDGLFRRGAATDAAVRALLERSAELEGQLRFVHIGAHIRTRALLSEAQVARYDELRGYAPEP